MPKIQCLTKSKYCYNLNSFFPYFRELIITLMKEEKIVLNSKLLIIFYKRKFFSVFL